MNEDRRISQLEEEVRVLKSLMGQFNPSLVYNKLGGSYTTVNREALARAYLGANQPGVADATLTTVELDTEVFDIGGNFASYIYTFPVTGYYQINFSVLGFCATAHNVITFFAAVADETDTNFLVGTRLYGSFPQDVLVGSTGSGLVYKAVGATAKLRVYADMDNAAATLTVYAGAASTYLDVHLISL